MAPYQDVVLSFLNEDPGPFCDTCLATRLGLPPHDVTMTTLNLEEQNALGVWVDYSFCKGCRRRERVIRQRR